MAKKTGKRRVKRLPAAKRREWLPTGNEAMDLASIKQGLLMVEHGAYQLYIDNRGNLSRINSMLRNMLIKMRNITDLIEEECPLNYRWCDEECKANTEPCRNEL